MKRLLILALVLLLNVPAYARQGCCSHHAGVCGCRCCDGSSLSAKCAPYYPACDSTRISNQAPKVAGVIPLVGFKTIDDVKQESNRSNPAKINLIDDIGLFTHDYYVVKRVIDGDTILLNNNERVRLIGVDTPETVHPSKPVEYFGKEASQFTKKMVEGKKVRLEYDQNSRDKYGRLLAYVFLEDNTFLNAEIIKQGYGHAYTKYPFKHMEEFRGYEREARETKRGLWADGSATKGALLKKFEPAEPVKEIPIPMH